MAGTATEARSTHTANAPSVWVFVSIVVSLVIGFGGGFLLAQGLEDEPQGLAPESVVKLLDDQIAALNADDVDALAATFATDAVLTDDVAGIETTGGREIAEEYVGNGIHVTRTSEIVMNGDFASYAMEFDASGTENVPAVVVYQIDDGKIVHQWTIGS